MNKKSTQLVSIRHLIWPALLTSLTLALVACASAGAPQDPAGKQFPPTPAVETPSLPAPASPTIASPTPALTPTWTPGVQGPLTGWKTFASTQYRYATTYPSDWSVATEKVGTMGAAENIERVIFKQPNYGKPNQFSSVTIEAAQDAYSTTGQCQGQSSVVSGIRGCRRSLPKGQNPAQELVFFQAPFSGGTQAFFYVQLVYDDSKYIDTFNQMLATWKFTSAAGSSPSAIPNSTATTKNFQSDRYGYVISYPATWAMQIQTAGPTGPGRDPENVFLTSPGGGLPQVQILALRGAPPITGFENCDKNLQFRGIPACSISISKGQIPAQQMLIFQRGDAYFHVAIQYETLSQLGVFDEIVRSLQFRQ